MASDPTPTEFVAPIPKHRLIGSVCTCGQWSAGCGHNIPEQWRQHVNASEEDS